MVEYAVVVANLKRGTTISHEDSSARDFSMKDYAGHLKNLHVIIQTCLINTIAVFADTLKKVYVGQPLYLVTTSPLIVYDHPLLLQF